MASLLAHLLICTTVSLAVIVTQVEARDDTNVVLLSATPSVVVSTVLLLYSKISTVLLLYSVMYDIRMHTC